MTLRSRFFELPLLMPLVRMSRLACPQAHRCAAVASMTRRGFADVVCLGASVMDMVAYVDNMPVVGETVLGNSFGTSFGGKGANQAVMAAKLGAEVAMISKLGNDAVRAKYIIARGRSLVSVPLIISTGRWLEERVSRDNCMTIYWRRSETTTCKTSQMSRWTRPTLAEPARHLRVLQ